MKNQPLVTIITVCKNSETTIGRTIESIKRQSWKNIQYIVVDGESTDRTREIVEANNNVVDLLISEKDSGIYYAMNKGLKLANGSIIGILNSDDWYEDDAVENSVTNIMRNDVDMSFGRMAIWRGTNLVRISDPSLPNSPYSSVIHSVHPTVFIKKTVYEKYGMFNTKYKIAADRDLIIRFLVAGAKVMKTDSLIANFSLDGASKNYNGWESINLLRENGAGWVNIFLAIVGFSKNLVKNYVKVKLYNGP